MTDSQDDGTPRSVPIEETALETALQRLESGMKSGETYHSHDEVRPSGVGMARDLKIAYEELVRAHPDYELEDGADG